MPVTLGSSNATEGTDFSTTVSGFTASQGERMLINSAGGVYHLAAKDATSMTLTAAGADLRGGKTDTIMIEYADGQTSSGRVRDTLQITVARAALVAAPGLSVTSPAPSTAVNIAPAGSNVPSGTVYELIDAVSQRRVDAARLGLTVDASTGVVTGTLAAGRTLPNVVVVGRKGGQEVVRSQSFSLRAPDLVPFFVPTPPSGSTPAPTPTPSLPSLGQVTLIGNLKQGVAASGASLSGLTDGSSVVFSIGGISVSTSGSVRAITGTPTASGPLDYTESLSGYASTNAILGTVAPASVTGNSLTVSPATATVGTAAVFTISGTQNGTTLTGTVPNGMTLNSSGRKITGTPTDAGNFNIVLNEALPDGTSKQSTIAITIAPANAPALGVSPSDPSISTATPIGSTVFLISSVPSGVTPTVNDARFAVAGDAANGFRCVVANTITAGTINVTVAATGATSVTVPVTVTAVTTTPAALAAPTPVDGVVGGDSLYPQGSVLKGPNASVFAVGAGLNDGTQVVRLFDHSTGNLVETRTVRQIDGKDDHKGVCVAAYSNGGFTAFATGHNNVDDFRVFFSDRDPSGAWTEQTISYPQRVTYPTGLLDKNEQLLFFLRVNNNTWTLRFRNGFAGTFNNPVTFVTHDLQLYLQSPRYDPLTHRVYCNIRTNDDEANNSGRIKLVEFDVATGEWFDANGGLGKMDGTASADTGKKLPFTFSSIATQFERNVDANGNSIATYRVEDRSYDGRRMIVRTSIDSAVAADGKDHNEVRVWQCPTGSRMVASNWQQGPLIYDMERTAAGGPKCRFDVSPKASTSIRFFGERGFSLGANDVWWQLSRYDSTDNGATWTETVMERSPMLILHQCPLENAIATTPVPYLQYANFLDYNSFTQVTTRFFMPNRVVGPIVLNDGFSETVDTLLENHTPNLGGAWTRKAAVSSTNPATVSASQSRVFATSTAQYNNNAQIPANAKKVRVTMKISALGSTDNTVVLGAFADTTAYTCYTASARRSTGALGVNIVTNGQQLTKISGNIGKVNDGDSLELEIEQIDASTRKLTLLYNGLIRGTPYIDTTANTVTGRGTDMRFATATTTGNGGLAPTALMTQVLEQ